MKKELNILLNRIESFGDICFIDEFGSYEESTTYLTDVLDEAEWAILKNAITVKQMARSAA